MKQENYILPEGESVRDPFGFDQMMLDWETATGNLNTLEPVMKELDRYGRYGLPKVESVKAKFEYLFQAFTLARLRLQSHLQQKQDVDPVWGVGDKFEPSSVLQTNEQVLREDLARAVGDYRVHVGQVEEWLQMMHNLACAHDLFDRWFEYMHASGTKACQDLFNRMGHERSPLSGNQS